MTDDIEVAAGALIARVEELGGAVAGIEAGFQKAEIDARRTRSPQQTEAGDRIVVGVNRFHVDSEEHYQPLHMDPATENEQAQRLALLRVSGDKAAHRIALDDLKEAATGDRNLLYPMREALRARATVGEVCDAFREVYGVYKPPTRFSAPDRINEILKAASSSSQPGSPGLLTAATPRHAARSQPRKGPA